MKPKLRCNHVTIKHSIFKTTWVEIKLKPELRMENTINTLRIVLIEMNMIEQALSTDPFLYAQI